MQAETASRHLLLVGGGQSHLYVLKHFVMLQRRSSQTALPPIKITLLSNYSHTLYSGMTPGVIAGLYQPKEALIDLQRLCRAANIDFVEDTFTALDPQQQSVHCSSGKAITYDWLSLNIGSEPDLSSIAGADSVGIGVKPINRFLEQWQHIYSRLSQQSKPHLCVVGGGAASVELVFAIQHTFEQHARPLRISLVCATNDLLPGHNPRVRNVTSQQLEQHQIAVIKGQKVTRVESAQGNCTILLDNQRELNCIEVIWAIHATAPRGLTKSGLNCDPSGFIRVNQHLQSLSHNNIFAAGDLAHFEPGPLAKSGVYAVRQGPILAENLQRSIAGQALLTYRPQKHFLSLLSLGNGRAIASRGRLCLTGRWVWRWKDAIDRRFIRQFQEFPG